MLPTLPRFARFGVAVLALASTSGCGWLEPALQVHVTLAPEVQATCVRVAVFTSSDVSGEAAGETRVERPAGKDEIFVAVYKGALPSQVFVTARPMFGNGCADPLVFNGEGDVSSATYPPTGTTQVNLALEAPTAGDADGDGFVATPGGADCNDGVATVHPGAPEQCSEPADYNCDGRIGCADPVCPPSACLPVPTQLAFISSPWSLVAGACSPAPVLVDTVGTGGAAIPVVAPTTVTFAAVDANLSIFSDACVTPVTSITIPTGQSRASVYVSGTVAGSARLSATAPSLGTVEQTETIQPGPLNQLVFTTAAQTAVALNGCSEPVTVQLRDAFGNPTSAGTPISLALSSDASGSTFRFYPDAACLNAPITLTPVASGASTSTFYFKSTATSAGTVTITVTGQGKTVTQAVGLVVRTPTQLVFPNAPVTAGQNLCSPAVTLQTQDALGQPAPVLANLNIPLSATGGTLTFFRDAACGMVATSALITAGLSSTSFYFKGPQGTPTITANGGAFGNAMQTETITAPVATQLAFATAAQAAVVAGACSGAVDIDARDAAGTPTAVGTATQVDLATNPAGQVSLYLAAGCGGSPINSAIMAAGATKVTISFKGTLAASTDIQASTAGNVLAADTQSEGVVAAAPAKVVITAGQNQTLSTVACGTLTLDQQDSFGNPATGAAQTINLSSSPSAGMAFYGAAGCSGGPVTTLPLPAGSQRAFAYFKGSTGGSYTLTEDPQGALTGDTAMETIIGGVATELRFTSTAQSNLPAGMCSAPVTVAAYDAAGNPVAVGAATTVTIAAAGAAGPGVTFYTSSSCTGGPVTSVNIPNGSGAATYYFKGTTAGSGTLTATATGLTSPAPQAFSILPGPPAKLVFSKGPITAVAGVCSGFSAPLAVQVQDTFGNPSPAPSNITVAISSANGGAPPAKLSLNQNCNGPGLTTFTIGAGNSTSSDIFFLSDVAGTWTITVSSAPLTGATQDETVDPGMPTLFYTSAAQTLARNACSALVTFQIQDQYGNLVTSTSNTSVTLAPSGGFYTNSTCTTANGANAVTVNAGQTNGSFYFKAPGTAGSYTITISGVGSPVNQVETIQ